MVESTISKGALHQAIKTVRLFVERVILLEHYEDFEQKALISALQILLKEAEGK